MIKSYFGTAVMLFITISQAAAYYLRPEGVSLDSYSRMVEFMDALTQEFSGYRAVQSSGGAAGGVVSEGQGYGLLISSTVAASLDKSDPRREEAVTFAYQLFLGWKKMCQLTDGGSCQEGGYYCGSDQYPCLPNWMFNGDITAVWGTGSAPDGDEDGILGLIILVETTRNEDRAWWQEVAEWTYFSCKAFMDFNTQLSSSGNHRILKLGSCFGGWDCSNPSYFAPAHYTAFRNFMTEYAEMFNSDNPCEGEEYKPMWDNLVRTMYLVLEANQCPSTGLVTNWYKPNENDPSTGGSVAGDCAYSGTPYAEFGSEACRTMWRVALDYLWNGLPGRSDVFLQRIASQATSKLRLVNNGCSSSSCNAEIALDTPSSCFVASVLEPWTNIPFMLGPVSTAMMFPLPASDPEFPYQQQALNFAADRIDSSAINDYYSGSWIAISTITLSGDILTANPANINSNTSTDATDTTADATDSTTAAGAAAITSQYCLLLNIYIYLVVVLLLKS